MKLFVFAALVAVAAAARLEHLERAYLPPFHGSNGGFGAGLQAPSAGPFGAATSNQYLPPDHGPSNGEPEFAGSIHGFGGQNFRSQQFSGHQAAPAQQYGAPQAGSSFGSPSYQGQYSQYAATNRQYLAPTSSLQNPPQQAFDEQTGYHY